MGVKVIVVGMGGNDGRYNQLEVILKDNWREIEDKSISNLIDPKKLSKSSTKDIKQIMRAFPKSDVALVLILKVKMSNKTAYKEFRSRERRELATFPKEIKSLYWQKIALLEEKCNVMNDIALYKELISAAE